MNYAPTSASASAAEDSTTLIICLAPHVADMWPTLRVGPTRKSPRHTQFSSITADKYKSVRHVELSYPENISFVILTNSGSRSKKLSNNEPYHATTYNMDGLADGGGFSADEVSETSSADASIETSSAGTSTGAGESVVLVLDIDMDIDIVIDGVAA